MLRFGLSSQPVRLLLRTTIEEYVDLVVQVWTSDFGTKITEATPIPRADLPGLHEALITISDPGKYKIIWLATNPEIVSVNHDLIVLAEPSVFPSHSIHVLNEQEKPVLLYSQTASVTYNAYFVTNSLTKYVSNSSATLIQDHYVGDIPLFLNNVGTYLIEWFVNGVFYSFDVWDVFSPVSAVSVSLGFYSKTATNPYSSGVCYLVEQTTGKVHRFKVINGIASGVVPQGDYRVALYDGPTRIFQKNNWSLSIRVDNTSSNITLSDLVKVVSYDVGEWVDITVSEGFAVPPEFRSIMQVTLGVGPSGMPAAYRKFYVEMLVTWYDAVSGILVLPERKEFWLDANGKANVPLIKNSLVRIAFPAADVTSEFVVPNSSEFELTDIISTKPDPLTIVIPKVYEPTKTS